MQLIKYQCRRCRYVFVQLHLDGDIQAAACPRCHHHDLNRQADFAAVPLPGLPKIAECTERPTSPGDK